MQCILLDIGNQKIQQLIEEKKWKQMADDEMIASVYDFVRNEIKFGYNVKDDLKGSEILGDGIGQRNTKSTLLMTLYKELNIETRLRAFYVDKHFQKQLLGLYFPFVPKRILHTWVEVLYHGQWIALEGVIMDDVYLKNVKKLLENKGEKDCYAYAIAVNNLASVDLNFSGESTFIQKEAILEDLGIFDSPEALYKKHQQDLGPLKNWIYINFVQKTMNKKVLQVRSY